MGGEAGGAARGAARGAADVRVLPGAGLASSKEQLLPEEQEVWESLEDCRASASRERVFLWSATLDTHTKPAGILAGAGTATAGGWTRRVADGT